MKARTIKVDMLARVEGEGALTLKFQGDALSDVKLRIFEPPRFYEAFLRGRRFDEAPDITARICGICPVAYQMSASTAMERALGIEVGGQLRELRRLLYCGEWIESHALHVHLLHAPDFLGFADGIQMAGEHKAVVARGLSLKKLGNHLMTVLGGREIHPVNVRVGGFYSLPTRERLLSLRPEIEQALSDAIAATEWVATLPMPDFEPEAEFVCMKHPDEYPLFAGRLVSNRGLDIALEEFEDHFVEVHRKHAHALHALRANGGCYHVGPLARFNLCREQLHPEAARLAGKLNLPREVRNPFMSIVVRAIETVYACEEALRIVDAYQCPSEPSVSFSVRAGEGVGCSEAPRGLCWHRYAVDAAGDITFARIVPPTSQNQARIEQDLREWAPRHVRLSDEELKWQCEHAIRNYDPCISCATHFLRLEVLRR